METTSTAPQAGLFEPVPLGSVKFQSSILPVLQNSYMYTESASCFQYSDIHLVNSAALLEEYQAFRAEKWERTCTEEELEESFGFLLFDQEEKAKEVCAKGLRVGHSTCSTLGDPSKGVYVSKHSDCLDCSSRHHGKSGFIAILRLTKGRVKEVRENHTQNFTAPTLGFDCHVSERIGAGSTASSFLPHERVQYFLYEPCGQGEGVAERPRHILPFALVAFSYRETAPYTSMLRHNSSTERAVFHYHPWRGQLQMKSLVYHVTLRSTTEALTPAQLPTVLVVDRVMKLSDLRKDLPQVFFETCFDSEVSQVGRFCSLYEVVTSEAQDSSLALLTQELKKKEMALTLQLNDFGLFVLLNSSYFLTYQGKADALLAMFVFPNSRAVHKERKIVRSRASPDMLQVLPGLNYAETEAEKCPLDQQGALCELVEQHLQSYATLNQPGLPDSPSREASWFQGQYDTPEMLNFYNAPKCGEVTLQRLQAYLGRPEAYTLPVVRAMELLAVRQEERDHADKDVHDCLSPPEEIPPTSASFSGDGKVVEGEPVLPGEAEAETNITSSLQQDGENGAVMPADVSQPTVPEDHGTPGTAALTCAEPPSKAMVLLTVPMSGDQPMDHDATVAGDGGVLTSGLVAESITEPGLQKPAEDTVESTNKVGFSCVQGQGGDTSLKLVIRPVTSMSYESSWGKKKKKKKKKKKEKKVSHPTNQKNLGQEVGSENRPDTAQPHPPKRKGFGYGLKTIITDCGRMFIPHGSMVLPKDIASLAERQKAVNKEAEEMTCEPAGAPSLPIETADRQAPNSKTAEKQTPNSKMADRQAPDSKTSDQQAPNSMMVDPQIPKRGRPPRKNPKNAGRQAPCVDPADRLETGVPAGTIVSPPLEHNYIKKGETKKIPHKISAKKIHGSKSLILKELRTIVQNIKRRKLKCPDVQTCEADSANGEPQQKKSKSNISAENELQDFDASCRKPVSPSGTNITQSPKTTHLLGSDPTLLGKMRGADGQEGTQLRRISPRRLDTKSSLHPNQLPQTLKSPGPPTTLENPIKLKPFKKQLRSRFTESTKEGGSLNSDSPTSQGSEMIGQPQSQELRPDGHQVCPGGVSPISQSESTSACQPADALNLLADLALGSSGDKTPLNLSPALKTNPSGAPHQLSPQSIVETSPQSGQQEPLQCTDPLGPESTNRPEATNQSPGNAHLQYPNCSEQGSEWTRNVVQVGETIHVTRLWKDKYEFGQDSKYTNEPLVKAVLRALHGPWDFCIEETFQQAYLILHTWIGLFYSKSTTRFFQTDPNGPVLEGRPLSLMTRGKSQVKEAAPASSEVPQDSTEIQPCAPAPPLEEEVLDLREESKKVADPSHPWPMVIDLSQKHSEALDLSVVSKRSSETYPHGSTKKILPKNPLIPLSPLQRYNCTSIYPPCTPLPTYSEFIHKEYRPSVDIMSDDSSEQRDGSSSCLEDNGDKNCDSGFPETDETLTNNDVYAQMCEHVASLYISNDEIFHVTHGSAKLVSAGTLLSNCPLQLLDRERDSRTCRTKEGSPCIQPCRLANICRIATEALQPIGATDYESKGTVVAEGHDDFKGKEHTAVHDGIDLSKEEPCTAVHDGSDFSDEEASTAVHDGIDLSKEEASTAVHDGSDFSDEASTAVHDGIDISEEEASTAVHDGIDISEEEASTAVHDGIDLSKEKPCTAVHDGSDFSEEEASTAMHDGIDLSKEEPCTAVHDGSDFSEEEASTAVHDGINISEEEASTAVHDGIDFSKGEASTAVRDGIDLSKEEASTAVHDGIDFSKEVSTAVRDGIDLSKEEASTAVHDGINISEEEASTAVHDGIDFSKEEASTAVHDGIDLSKEEASTAVHDGIDFSNEEASTVVHDGIDFSEEEASTAVHDGIDFSKEEASTAVHDGIDLSKEEASTAVHDGIDFSNEEASTVVHDGIDFSEEEASTAVHDGNDVVKGEEHKAVCDLSEMHAGSSGSGEEMPTAVFGGRGDSVTEIKTVLSNGDDSSNLCDLEESAIEIRSPTPTLDELPYELNLYLSGSQSGTPESDASSVNSKESCSRSATPTQDELPCDHESYGHDSCSAATEGLSGSGVDPVGSKSKVESSAYLPPSDSKLSPSSICTETAPSALDSPLSCNSPASDQELENSHEPQTLPKSESSFNSSTSSEDVTLCIESKSNLTQVFRLYSHEELHTVNEKSIFILKESHLPQLSPDSLQRNRKASSQSEPTADSQSPTHSDQGVCPSSSITSEANPQYESIIPSTEDSPLSHSKPAGPSSKPATAEDGYGSDPEQASDSVYPPSPHSEHSPTEISLSSTASDGTSSEGPKAIDSLQSLHGSSSDSKDGNVNLINSSLEVIPNDNYHLWKQDSVLCQSVICSQSKLHADRLHCPHQLFSDGKNEPVDHEFDIDLKLISQSKCSNSPPSPVSDSTSPSVQGSLYSEYEPTGTSAPTENLKHIHQNRKKCISPALTASFRPHTLGKRLGKSAKACRRWEQMKIPVSEHTAAGDLRKGFAQKEEEDEEKYNMLGDRETVSSGSFSDADGGDDAVGSPVGEDSFDEGEIDEALDYSEAGPSNLGSEGMGRSRATCSVPQKGTNTAEQDWFWYRRGGKKRVSQNFVHMEEEEDEGSAARPSIITVLDSRGNRRTYENYPITKTVLSEPNRAAQNRGKGSHHLHSFLQKWEEPHHMQPDLTQSSLNLQYLIFSEKMNQILRNNQRNPEPPGSARYPWRKRSTSDMDRSPHDSSGTLQLTRFEDCISEDPMGKRRKKRDTLKRVGLLAPEACTSYYPVDSKTSQRLRRLSQANGVAEPCPAVSNIAVECAKSYRVMMNNVCSGTKPLHDRLQSKRTLQPRRNDSCRQVEEEFGSSRHGNLKATHRLPCKGKFRFYILVTSTDAFFEQTKELLEAEGNVSVEPDQFDLRGQSATSTLQIFLRNEDIADYVSTIPHLLKLKETPWVQFSGVDRPEDVLNYTHQELFRGGGFTVCDADTLGSFTLRDVKSLVGYLENLNERSRWKWLLHYRDGRHLKENGRRSSEARRLKHLLDRCQEAGLVEVMPYHECDVISRERPDYLCCLRRLQVQHATTRFLVFITDTPEDSFEKCGVLATTLYSFSRISRTGSYTTL
ncbi:hypothetical protein SKAU_G00041690 [Synaphobranchus kaupii]|uniref:DUF3715 domain-containing protein n=1 Tax=Synaphobranchus kaupii TaxID=118154 RepID=A0A9Q1J6P8_SYNKA|nr:hypothetical protein SKAU_G00041690 [Synaphobranchus kaupii]